MLIGELATELGVTTKTLRHYEKIGLLPEARRAENGYRFYGDEAVLIARQIVALRELDLSLAAIKTLLADKDRSTLRKRLIGMLDEYVHEYILQIAILQGKQEDLNARFDALLMTPSAKPGDCICGLLLKDCDCEKEPSTTLESH